MPSGEQDVAIRKRQQIDSSKKTMFFFVAGAAFLAGVALVVSIFLIQQIIFHSKVIATKNGTVSTLHSNISNAKELKDNIRVLETNDALKSVKSSDDSSPLQTILDALPAEPNADALGAALQQKFIGAVPGLTLESLTVDAASANEGESTSESAHKFNLSVSGAPDKLKELMERFEKSIRVIEITAMEIQAGDGKVVLNVQGKVPYNPAQAITLENKVVKP